MIISRKRREEINLLLEKNASEVETNITQYKEELAKAADITEAGERYLALFHVESGIKLLIDELETRTTSQIREKITEPRRTVLHAIGLGMMLISPIVIATSMCLPLLFAGFVIAKIGQAAEGSPEHRKMFSDLAGKARTSLTPILQKAVRLKEDIERNDLPGLMASKRFDDLCDRVPSLEETFRQAVERKQLKASLLVLDKPSFKMRLA